MYLLTTHSVMPVDNIKTKKFYVNSTDFVRLMNSQELREKFLTGLNREYAYIEPIFDTDKDGVKAVYKGVVDKKRNPFRVALPNMGLGD